MAIENEQWITDVIKAVMEKVNLPVNDTVVGEVKENKKKLLVSGGQRSDMESLTKHYDLEFAAAEQFSYQAKEYDAILLGELDNASLAKAAVGLLDNDYLKLIGEAILSRKPVYAITEGVELFQYKETAPPVYYRVFETHLETLKKSGVKVCTQAELISCLLRESGSAAVDTQADYSCKVPDNTKCFTRKVITERDMMELKKENLSSVQIGKRCIVTDLAKEFAQKNKITICRQ